MIVVCPVCGGKDLLQFLKLSDLPVFCNIQLETRKEALTQPRGDMHLEFCPDCSHVFNSAFDEGLLSYSESYENSLHFSATFSEFAENVAQRLVHAYSLRGKKILEIGCGKGDFLSLICELGANDGFGFDKSYEEGRSKVPAQGSVRYFKDFFSREYAAIEPDFIACRHVLEHIPDPRAFLREVLFAVGQDAERTFYIEVPNLLFTLEDMGIWDLIYEHCQYFSPQSLGRLFLQEGIEIRRIDDCFGRQFIALEGVSSPAKSDMETGDMMIPGESIADLVTSFRTKFWSIIERWQRELSALEGSAVVWGAGSKGTTFLNLLDTSDIVTGIIDINPKKHGKFTPGTGHQVLAPESLERLKPEHVFIMNPMYREEIESMIGVLGIDTQTHVVE